MKTKTINLQKFCGKQLRDYDLSEPFIQNKHQYAADGAIIVEVPMDKRDTKGRALPKRCREILDCAPKRGRKPWPRKRYIKYTWEFKERLHCTCLFGDLEKAQRVGTALIDAGYDAMIRELPNVMYAVSGGTIYFWFTGGRGAVMELARG